MNFLAVLANKPKLWNTNQNRGTQRLLNRSKVEVAGSIYVCSAFFAQTLQHLKIN